MSFNQKRAIMQNKPNSQNDKMNVNLTLTKDYRKKDDFAVQKKQTQFIPTEGGTKPIANRTKISGIMPNCCYNN